MKKVTLFLVAFLTYMFSANAQGPALSVTSDGSEVRAVPYLVEPNTVDEEPVKDDLERNAAPMVVGNPGGGENRRAAIVTWAGAATGGDWQVGSNWSSGSAPGASDDVMLTTGTTLIITNVPTTSIGTLTVDMTTTVHLRAAVASAVVTIAGGPSADLTVGAGSTLNLNGTLAYTLALAASTTGSISGTVQMGQAAHRLTAVSASGLTFQSGSLFKQFPGFSGNPFGTTNLNSVVFADGSVYSAKYGGTPFGPAAPNTVVIFQTNSLYRIDTLGAAHSFVNRTYGNIEINCQAMNTVFNLGTATPGGTVTMNNLTLTQGAFGWYNWGTVNVNGNITQGNATPTVSLMYMGHPTASLGVLTMNLNSATGTLALAAGATSTYFGIQIHNAPGGTTTVNVVNGANFSTSRSIYCANPQANMRVMNGGIMNFSPTIFCYIGSPTDGTGGKYSVEAGGRIGIGEAFGIMSAPTLNGNVQSQTRVFDPAGLYYYHRNLTGLQQTGTGLPTTITGTLAMNLGATATDTVFLNNVTTVNGTLILNKGKLLLGANNFVLGATATLTGGSSSSYAVTNGAGLMIRAAVGSVTKTFPLGRNMVSYDPVSITNTGTVDSFSVSIGAVPASALHPEKLVLQSYNISEKNVGGSNCTLALTYSAMAPLGASYNAANPIKIGHYNGSIWDETAATLSGTTATGSGFTSFSPFVVGNSQASTWYQDFDGDGFGNPLVTSVNLYVPTGYVADNTDCDDNNALIHAPVTYYADTDGDTYGDPNNSAPFCQLTAPSGYVTNTLDCDDSNAALPTNYYPDVDGDTYGQTGGTPVFACAVPSGYVGSNTDCNDSNAAIHPGATELPDDAVDQNCDTQELCYQDTDDDGYRPDASSTVNSTDLDCTDASEGQTADPTTDCNDNDATIHPGATEGVADGVDQNCDGQETCYADGDNDGYRPNATATTNSSDTDCADANEAVGSDPTTDCDDTNAAINPGATEICGNGTDENCDGSDSNIASFSHALSGIVCTSGKVTVTISAVNGGMPPFSYSKNNGSTYQTSNIFTGMAPATYSFVVKDNAGCTKVQSVTVNAVMAVATSATPVLCFGGNTGTAMGNVTAGGYGPFTFEWKNSAGMSIGTTQSVSSLTAGTYKFYATDAMSCVKSAAQAVTQPGLTKVIVTKTNALCFGGNGSATATGSGGVGGFTYAWSNGATGNALSAPAGTYTVTASDANSCAAMATAALTQPTDQAITFTSKQPKCFGGSDGSVKALSVGGTGTKTYAWSNGGNTQEILNLAVGNYTVTSTDANGCMKSNSFTLGQPTEVMITGYTIAGSGPYTVTITASGGTPPLKYARLYGAGLVQNGSSTGVFTNVPTGSYTFRVTDKNLCTKTQVYGIPTFTNQGDDRNKPELPVAQSFTLVPNPASGNVTVLFEGKTAVDGQLELHSVAGNLLRQFPASNLSSARLDLTGLPSGVLFVTYRTDSGARLTKRLVVLN